MSKVFMGRLFSDGGSAHVNIALTHLPQDKVVAISQTIFSDAFLGMKCFVYWLKFHLNLFLGG